jgi:hypothetical protein
MIACSGQTTGADPENVPPDPPFSVLRTKNLDEARDAVTRVYLDHELTAPNAPSI